MDKISSLYVHEKSKLIDHYDAPFVDLGCIHVSTKRGSLLVQLPDKKEDTAHDPSNTNSSSC